MSDKYTSAEYQQAVGDFVRREVIYCVSHLISELATPRDRAEFVGEGRFAWPGGYELFAVTDDGGILCKDCCIRERESIAASIPGDGWYVAAIDHAGNCDAEVICDNCSRVIFDPND